VSDTHAVVETFGLEPRGGWQTCGLVVGRRCAVEEALSSLDPDNMSPREALDALYKLKALTDG
jgi:DNA mismatch repair ATPase MutS